MKHDSIPMDTERDMILERTVDLPPERIWAAWTKPEHIIHWFTPAPWNTVDCEIDLVPGGIFRTVMRSPEGEEFSNAGCILEVVENRKLVWTDALGPGFRPADRGYLTEEGFYVTGVILLEPAGKGTLYRAMARHNSEESRRKHETMGFYEGWGKALDQLVEYMKQVAV